MSHLPLPTPTPQFEFFHIDGCILGVLLLMSWVLFLWLWAWSHQTKQPKQRIKPRSDDWMEPHNWRN